MHIKCYLCVPHIEYELAIYYLSKQAVFIVSILINKISVAWAKTWNQKCKQAVKKLT
jgi:hypothetical protein